MLEDMTKEIDAVVVAPRTTSAHAPASTRWRCGWVSTCYCEKPLTHSVYESRVLAKLAAENKVATRSGHQMHASSHYRRAIEILRSARSARFGRRTFGHSGPRRGHAASGRPRLQRCRRR